MEPSLGEEFKGSGHKQGMLNHYKIVFDLSNSISLHLFLILLKIVVAEKVFQKPNSFGCFFFFL